MEFVAFNHIIGLPKKDGTEKPIFDYQKILYDALLIPDIVNSQGMGLSINIFGQRKQQDLV